MSTPYFNEQLAQAHRQDLLQEAQQEQLLAQLPPSDYGLLRYITDGLTAFLRAVGVRLKQLLPHRERVLSD